jgi:predicted cupin superfamily sugar epimerase
MALINCKETDRRQMEILTADDLIRELALLPHPEGGYFREVYRAQETIAGTALPDRYSGERSFSTAIYYLLKTGQSSFWHKLDSDETWHYYSGGSLNIFEISAKGVLKTTVLGSDLKAGQVFQHTILQGNWFAATCRPKTEYVLAGCTVAPGFDFSDFQMARDGEMETLFPHLAELFNSSLNLKT